MGWMGANNGAGMPIAMMPGFASEDEMRSLSLASGLERGKRWIELMRVHHVGGVAMATAAVELASDRKVVRLATQQAAVQTYEISQYDFLLANQYA